MLQVTPRSGVASPPRPILPSGRGSVRNGGIMSTFYLLPPRPEVGECLARFLEQLFPGLEWPSSTWTELGEHLGALAARWADHYVVYRDEVPLGAPLPEVLADGFGAEQGDEVVEVVTNRRWRLGEETTAAGTVG